jgi:hypothetical protein
MAGHKNCLQADCLLGPGPRLIKKKNLPGRGLTKVEKHCSIVPRNNKSRLPRYLTIPRSHVCFGVLRDLSFGKLEIKRSVLVHAYRFLYNETNYMH